MVIVSIEMRDPATPRMGPRVRGARVLSGERHGRPVTARLGGEERGGASEITVGGPCPEFEAKARDGRVRRQERAGGDRRGAAGGPQLDPLETAAGERRPRGNPRRPQGGEQSDWLCDLWLAERLASV